MSGWYGDTLAWADAVVLDVEALQYVRRDGQAGCQRTHSSLCRSGAVGRPDFRQTLARMRSEASRCLSRSAASSIVRTAELVAR
jgi:hypothetical protein